MFDENGDGSISITELRNMMRTLGQDPSEKELQQIMDSADKDGECSSPNSLQCDLSQQSNRPNYA